MDVSSCERSFCHVMTKSCLSGTSTYRKVEQRKKSMWNRFCVMKIREVIPSLHLNFSAFRLYDLDRHLPYLVKFELNLCYLQLQEHWLIQMQSTLFFCGKLNLLFRHQWHHVSAYSPPIASHGARKSQLSASWPGISAVRPYLRPLSLPFAHCASGILTLAILTKSQAATRGCLHLTFPCLVHASPSLSWPRLFSLFMGFPHHPILNPLSSLCISFLRFLNYKLDVLIQQQCIVSQFWKAKTRYLARVGLFENSWGLPLFHALL